MEFAQRANIRDFVGPFTTSCDAQTRIVSLRRAYAVIARSTGYCEWANPIVLTRCRKLPNSNIYRFIYVGYWKKYDPSKHVGIGQMPKYIYTCNPYCGKTILSA